MAAYAGSALYVSWVYSGGTVALTGDFRQFTYTPSVDLYEATAGADAAKTYLPGVKDGQATFTAVMQAAGTAISNALLEGTEGTLTVAPEGTASGKQKMTLPAIALGATYSIPYNDVVELSANFQQNGVRTDTVF